MTNLPWQLDASLISQQFGIPTVRLLNDFAAQTYALEALPASELCTWQQGQPSTAARGSA